MLKTIEKLKKGDNVFIVCLGDSITEQNYHVHGKLNYVGQLWEKLLNTFGRNCFVLNVGVSGDTTDGMLDRLERDVLRFKPDMVTFMAGINDSANGREGLAKFESNLETIVEKISASGSEVLLLTQNPLCYDVREDAVMKRTSYPDYIEVIRKLAKEKNIPLCDINEKWKDHVQGVFNTHLTFMNDGLHPNEYGQGLIAEFLFDYLGI